MKKAQGMSVNTIIIAIIVLVVLVVLVMIFTSYFGGWTNKVASCQSQGGSCNAGTTREFYECQADSADSSSTFGRSDSLSGRCVTPQKPTKYDSNKDQVCCAPGTSPVSRTGATATP